MDLWQDLRYGVRRLIEARWFTLAAVAALSLGIGANTTVFTLVNAILLRGLPVDDPDRIMMVWTENEQNQMLGLSLPDYEDVRDQSRSFEQIAATLQAPVNISDDERLPEQTQGSYVTGNFFRMIGEQPALGRDFVDDDDRPGAEPVVLIGYDVWQGRFGGDPDVLGATIRVNSLVATVIGVMPEAMQFPVNTDVWIPQINLPPETGTENRALRNFIGIGRLASDVSPSQAREELRMIGQRLADEYPEANAELQLDLNGFVEQANGDEIRALFLALMGAVAFVLLIACANVANLLLAKSAERGREIAVRVSMGATRTRIVRQLLMESLLLAAVAGVVGLGIAYGGIRWFDLVVQEVGGGIPYWMVFTMDPVVFAFMAAVCLATALLFGLAPALHVSRTDVNEILKEGTRGGSSGVRSRRWAGALIIGEMALTLVLLSGAGFMMRSFMNLYTLDHGLDTADVVTMQIYLPLTKYPQPEPRMELFRDFLDRMDTAPAIASATLTTAMPLQGGGSAPVEIDGRETEPGETPPSSVLLAVSEEYFDVLGVDLLAGRGFNRDDGLPGSETAIVNQRFVDLHFGGGEAIGRRVRLGGGPLAPWYTVIGVAPTIRQGPIEEREDPPVAYMPLRTNPARTVGLMLRSRGDMAAATAAANEAMRAVEPDIPLFNGMTLEERLAEVRWPYRIFGTMFAIFAGIALVLSGVGLYSVTANSVIQRIREFGIRISLGAEPRTVSWLALRRVLVQLAIGLPIGVLGAFGMGSLLRSLLVQTNPGDPLTLVSIVFLMVGVAVLACLWPARRAGRIDPVAALRVE